jgi:hypothetical protein
MKNGVFWDVTLCGFLQEPHDITSQKRHHSSFINIPGHLQMVTPTIRLTIF